MDKKKYITLETNNEKLLNSTVISPSLLIYKPQLFSSFKSILYRITGIFSLFLFLFYYYFYSNLCEFCPSCIFWFTDFRFSGSVRLQNDDLLYMIYKLLNWFNIDFFFIPFFSLFFYYFYFFFCLILISFSLFHIFYGFKILLIDDVLIDYIKLRLLLFHNKFINVLSVLNLSDKKIVKTFLNILNPFFDTNFLNSFFSFVVKIFKTIFIFFFFIFVPYLLFYYLYNFNITYEGLYNEYEYENYMNLYDYGIYIHEDINVNFFYDINFTFISFFIIFEFFLNFVKEIIIFSLSYSIIYYLLSLYL